MGKESNEENEELEGMTSKLLKSRTVVISQQVDAKLTQKFWVNWFYSNRKVRKRQLLFS